MAKKSKQSNEVQTEPKKAAVVRKNPLFFLRDTEGNEFKFTHFPLPKKAAVAGDVLVNGSPTSFQVTSNKGFTKDDTVIHYSWLTLPSGHTGYIAHDYGVSPEDGVEYEVCEGATQRKDPVRVAKDATVGEARVEKFKATMAARKVAA
jgi:hypothetical protein